MVIFGLKKIVKEGIIIGQSRQDFFRVFSSGNVFSMHKKAFSIFFGKKFEINWGFS